MPIQFPDLHNGTLDKYSLGRLDAGKFAKTTVAVRGKDGNVRKAVDVSKRSSMTYAGEFEVLHPKSPASKFTLIKYEVGDFFTPHVDHKGDFTCLILGGTEYEGGVLKLNDNGVEVSVKPGANKYLMVIFAVDVQHEVTPVTKGVRYILKASIEEKTNDESYLPYKRINHFQDWIRNFQDKESTDEEEEDDEKGDEEDVFGCMLDGIVDVPDVPIKRYVHDDDSSLEEGEEYDSFQECVLDDYDDGGDY